MEKCDTIRQTTDYITRRKRIARWITKTTDIHSEYVLLFALSQQELLREIHLISHLYVHDLS